MAPNGPVEAAAPNGAVEAVAQNGPAGAVAATDEDDTAGAEVAAEPKPKGFDAGAGADAAPKGPAELAGGAVLDDPKPANAGKDGAGALDWPSCSCVEPAPPNTNGVVAWLPYRPPETAGCEVEAVLAPNTKGVDEADAEPKEKPVPDPGAAPEALAAGAPNAKLGALPEDPGAAANTQRPGGASFPDAPAADASPADAAGAAPQVKG